MYLRGRQPLRLRLLQPQLLVSQQHAPLFCKASFTALSLCVPLSVCLLVRKHTIDVFHAKNTENLRGNLRIVANMDYQLASFSSTKLLFCKASFTALKNCVPPSLCLLVRTHTIDSSHVENMKELSLCKKKTKISERNYEKRLILFLFQNSG